MELCYHCGDPCETESIRKADKYFCCLGCVTVFDILNSNDLSYYYELETRPGITPSFTEGKYDYLKNPDLVSRLLEFEEQDIAIVSFLIPSIHCSSCIWVLENLNKLHPKVRTSQVNFSEKTLRITYETSDAENPETPERHKLKEIVELLCRMGYEPHIALENSEKKQKHTDRSLIYKLGVAGFAFGNVMFLSFPEYFEMEEFWLEQFKHMFRWLMFAFSVPVVLYSGKDYFISAFKSIRSGMLNIDIPIALGIAVLFIRSTIDIVFDWGTGFFDSLTGLVFFLLLGRYFQQKTYAYLSFERDYRSYFPLAVTRVKKMNSIKTEEQVNVNEVEKGDLLLIRNNELIPVDAVILNGTALIDYSFVTGEADPISKHQGDLVYAGGRQLAGIIEVEVIKPVAQSYLTQLWSRDVFSKKGAVPFRTLTDTISKRFTITILTVAILATLFWLITDPSLAFNVFTAVLIVACPCAIALAAPFTLGNLIRILGYHRFYLKDTQVLERMSQIDTIVFDKTGTLTSTRNSVVRYEGIALNPEETKLLSSSLRASNHPLSRALHKLLKANGICTLDAFEEAPGKGITSKAARNTMKVGSYDFVASSSEMNTARRNNLNRTSVHISTNNRYKGCYIFETEYREGVSEIFSQLDTSMPAIVLSGDNEGERQRLEGMLPKGTTYHFNKKPEEKLDFIKSLQEQGKKVMMIGDGLNDSGALKQSDVGIVISEDINVFSPACDGILDASRFSDLLRFFRLSQTGMTIIKTAFIISLLYNIIGLAFAVTGHLKPVVAAILMPLSSISIVVFTTLATRYVTRHLSRSK